MASHTALAAESGPATGPGLGLGLGLPTTAPARSLVDAPPLSSAQPSLPGLSAGSSNPVSFAPPSGQATSGVAGSLSPSAADPATAFVIRLEPTPDPTEAAYRDLLAVDDAAQEDMDRWIREADAQAENADNAGLQKKVAARLAEVDQAYRIFLEKHPDHARARIAFGSFLNDTGREFPARDQWELALKLDPLNPAIFNNLAGSYGHRGPVTNAFVYYEKAIALDPKEPVYYQNFATTVFLFRRDVMEHYGFADEQKVFDKALGLYRKAMELQPDNFYLAADLAQTFYGVKPPRHDEALKAWRRALELAGDDLEREGVRVHVARVLVQAGRYSEARSELGGITNAQYAVVKERIAKTLERKVAGGTNAPAGAADF